jgi:hypothetical protein
MFLHECANAMWNSKEPKGPPHFFVLVTFCYQKISITLEKMQASSILRQVVAINLAISQLPPLQNLPPSPQLTSY